MRKFLVKEDITILGKTILHKNQSILVDISYTIPAEPFDISLPIGHILKDDRFEEITQDFKFEIKELTDVEEDEIKTYRIQLDVKASRRKLREIENYLRSTLDEMI